MKAIERFAEVYGRDAEIYLKHFCRPETRFESLEALKERLAADIEQYRPIKA